jgi:hypothetical protein
MSNNTNRSGDKPKLIFFQWKYDPNLPAFLLNHAHDHVKGLSHFFDVTVINENCDYQEVCDRYRPDMTLFEAGLDNLTCRKPVITNTHTHPHIPKAALHNADAFSGARAGFLSDLHHWGVETVFAIAATAAEHTPDISANIIVWPNFIDPDVYRDYGERKSIPVLLTGNRTTFYPWRQKVFRQVSEYFPSLQSPHPGYEAGSSLITFMVGENYARTLNASSIVPSCGTVAMEVVRKHFEIPACRSCLVTERSPALEAAGFVDMQNCVFADEHDVLDKLSYLFRNTDVLARITDAGHQLVHSRHTLRQRDEVRRWFDLQKQLRSGQKVVQTTPFGPLSIVDAGQGYQHPHLVSNGLHLKLLSQGHEALRAGKLDEAELAYVKCLNYMRWLPEAKLGLAQASLLRGNAGRARDLLESSIGYVVNQYGAADPDPVEWAYLIVSLLCQGNREAALAAAGRYPRLKHPELDRARWVAAFLSGKATAGLPMGNGTSRRRTLHPSPLLGPKEWIDRIRSMLNACGQKEMADTLNGFDRVQGGQGASSAAFVAEPEPVRSTAAPAEAPARASGSLLGNLKRRIRQKKLGNRAKKVVSGFVHGLERKYGYFLPYHLSEKRNDELYRTVRILAREEAMKSVLIVGATTKDTCTKALLAGLAEGQNDPVVVCISARSEHTGQLHPNRRPIVWEYRLGAHEGAPLAEALAKTVNEAKGANGIQGFDVVLIDSSELRHVKSLRACIEQCVGTARTVLLLDINSANGFDSYQRLLDDDWYQLVADNPSLRSGYSIFRRRRSVGAGSGVAVSPWGGTSGLAVLGRTSVLE